jgi:acyl-homoserine lactone acylase PvdQ
MSRRFALLVAIALGGATLPEGAGAQPEPPATPDHLRAFSIFPPGQEGNVTAAELASGDFGPHYDDQLDLYADLPDDHDVTNAELGTYFHSMQFGPEGAVEATYSPTAGVTVYRDAFGIPHIYADSLDGASFALGYTTAEDRLWQMDVFRHAARGTLAEFVGAGEDDEFLEMDIQTRREGYTEAEVQATFDTLDERFGAIGTQVQDGLQGYTEGVNLYIQEVKTTRVDERPVEYEATGNPPPVHPEDWEVADTLFLVVLQLRVFGETAGFELENAAVYQHLVDRLGPDLGPEVFEDLMRRDDPRSPTTIPASEGRFPSQDLGPVDPDSVALPDDPGAVAARAAAEMALRQRVLGSIGFPTAPTSNALLVAAEESTTGNPLQLGAPQVGYAVPAFFIHVDVHAPGVDFYGPAVPGASALIPLGRGADYAWSLTTGFSDAVDVRAELLCEPDGGEPTVDSEHYLFEGECRAMDSRQETFVVKPPPVDPGPPQVVQRTIHRTVHGPVFDRGTVGGRPVAFVKERFFWMKEIDSVPSFLRWNTQVDTIEDFADAARDFTMSFNAFYADAQHIGYFHVGHYPRRPDGMSPLLPTWGTGEWEWSGRFPFIKHPQVVDPDRGWLANWNNKPAEDWANFDDFGWGPTQRVLLLHRLMGELLEGPGQASLSDVVDVIRIAATQDVRGAALGPRMVAWASTADGSDAFLQALQKVRTWIGAGAHRRNADRDDDMDRGAALATFDAWYDALVHRVFDDELGGGFYDLVGGRLPVSDYNPAGGSSFFFDFSNYLANLFQASAREELALDYCDDSATAETETCRRMVVKSLRQAVQFLQQEQGPDVSAWSTPAENLVFQEQGAGSVDPIPWQNRGTHNHAVEILSDAG